MLRPKHQGRSAPSPPKHRKGQCAQISLPWLLQYAAPSLPSGQLGGDHTYCTYDNYLLRMLEIEDEDSGWLKGKWRVRSNHDGNEQAGICTYTHAHTCSTEMNFLEPLAELKLLVPPLKMAVCTTCSGRVEEEESLFICNSDEKWESGEEWWEVEVINDKE